MHRMRKFHLLQQHHQPHLNLHQDMNPDSLNKGTVTIKEIKHSSDLICLYQFRYDHKARTLIMQPKSSYFNFGTGNTIFVTISGGIQNQAGKQMGTDFTWSFRTVE
jgi:hypothetical protein